MVLVVAIPKHWYTCYFLSFLGLHSKREIAEKYTKSKYNISIQKLDILDVYKL